NNTCDTKIWIYDHCLNVLVTNTNVGTIYYDDEEGGCGDQAVVPAALLEGGVEYWIRIGTDAGDCPGAIEWTLTYNGPIAGCMDPTNCHYNPLATVSVPCEPCTDGPDLVLRQDVLENSMYLAEMNVAQGDCFIEELCMNGYGNRDILRFTTHILNIGTLDYYIGSPSANPDQFDFNNCHGHTHYAGYAAYRLYDPQANEIPIGFKNGFCVMDLECSGGGTAQYGCSTMGITAGCGDIYSSGLSCQWIDITDVDTGTYTFVVTTNWDQDPDALGHHELSYTNNWAQVCIYIGKDGNGDMFVDQVQDCTPFVDCAGEIYGEAQPDCNGDCGGLALAGDLNTDTAQTIVDGQMYVDAILDNSLTPADCNDLNADGEIDVFDAALISDCALYNEGQNTSAIYNHCEFPYGLLNIFDTLDLSIGHVDLAQGYIDIYLQNPDNFVVAYQFGLTGIEIASVENLIDPNVYPITPEWNTDGTIVGISFQDSLIPKYVDPTPLCRVYYSSLTDTIVCIDPIQSFVNQAYEEVITRVDPFNTCILAYTGIEELTDGGIELNIFPNPMTESTTLRIYNRFNADFNVSLVDPTGRVIRDYGQVTTNEITIQKDELSSGIYFVQVTNENRILNRERLIIQ
ncbi:MAG: lysyl oxidase family protein, partial [Flavobacteriales bacterium]|nr:lysyl oxidase family protein [Flavobacteriales bacterium]